MPLLTWNDDYSVHIDEIDEQHKLWVRMLNDLHDAMKAGKGKDKVGETLSGLVNYTKVHFAKEEELMRSAGYRYFAEHKRIHEDMVKEVESLLTRYKSGELVITLEVMQFLKNWLSEHILLTDKNYGPYLNSRGIK